MNECDLVAKMLLLFSTAFALLAIIGSSNGVDFPDELVKPENAAPKFAEDTVGLDLHNDFFYYSDKKVSNALKRGNFLSVKVTLAGQQPDLVGRSQPAVSNPFAVGQKASRPVNSLDDRWDYKQTEKGYQFFGLYHGQGNAFVVNKIRAQLLRRVANEVQDFLPFLDQAFEDPELKDNKLYQDDIKHSVAHIIKSVYAEIDTSICASMTDNDDSLAAATVVIITDHYVIVINSGDGRVLGYDSTSLLRDLTSAAAILNSPLVEGQKKEFGANKSKSKGLAEPDLAFFERQFVDPEGDEAKIQFLTIQTGLAASAVSDEETKKIVISQVDVHKYRQENEQDLHTGVVTNLLQAASSRTPIWDRWFKNTDFSAIFIALETTYKNIH